MRLWPTGLRLFETDIKRRDLRRLFAQNSRNATCSALEQHPIERLLCQPTNWPIASIDWFDFRLRRMLPRLDDVEQLPDQSQSVYLVIMLAGRKAEKL